MQTDDLARARTVALHNADLHVCTAPQLINSLEAIPPSCCCRLLRGVQRLQLQLQSQLPALSGLSCRTSVQPYLIAESSENALSHLFTSHSPISQPSQGCWTICNACTVLLTVLELSQEGALGQMQLWINVEASRLPSDKQKSAENVDLRGDNKLILTLVQGSLPAGQNCQSYRAA